MEKRRIIPAFLVLFVIFAIVPRPCAVAAGMSGLEVVGQTAMTQQTFTDLSVIGADSCGLTDAINGTKNPAQSIGEWIKGEWDSWLLRQQLTWGTVLNIAAAGARYTGNGDLLFNSQLSDLFTRFYNWLWDGEDGPNISENAETETVDPELVLSPSDSTKSQLWNPSYDYSGVRVYYNTEFVYNEGNEQIKYRSNLDSNMVFLRNGTNNSYIFLSDQRFTVSGQKYNASGNATTSYGPYSASSVSHNGHTFYYWGGGIPNNNQNYSTSFEASVVYDGSGNVISASNNTVAWDIAYIIFVGDISQIGEDQILGDPDKLGGLTGSERKKLAPPDLLDFPDFGGNSGTIDVNDYINGLRGAIESEDGTADIKITDSEGVESTQQMEMDQTTDIPAETEAASDIVNQGELISTATPSTELADYTLDLRNYFPFCIPWDLYDMITLLVAEPVAPHLQYPFVIEPLNVNYTIDLDFSQFDSVAAVLRNMELLAAGIGLALMTKRLIQGGD